jgi:hypothetical protein
MKKYCPDADVLRTVENPDDYDDDEDSMAAYEAEAKSKGYDTSELESSGQVFLKAA